MEGQLTIYNYRAEKNDNEKDASYCGPCYRCLFPSPPPPETVGSCSANGVCGPVPGSIGTLQALEAIKLVVGFPHGQLLVGRMLIFDGEDATFRIVKLRPRDPNCAACSENPKITQLLDYETFCRSKAKEKDLDLKILEPQNRITATRLASKLKENLETSEQRHLLVDVRSEPEFHMCRIEGAVNYPIDSLDKKQEFDKLLEAIRSCTSQVTFICRRGNDSQLVAQRVLDAIDKEQSGRITDLTGGLHAWAKLVDQEFPIY
ncbi:hypothetical protein JYU34_022806 [Plutella xylostella]|uniref:Ubiquitin activating enzyme 4 n=3 Tax=Plutella xylostella TaxID=51655 RepID=A0ABQ7PPA3_PLUXY|nr:hypothetical protein JYU34_022806 [Plutella xylostella]